MIFEKRKPVQAGTGSLRSVRFQGANFPRDNRAPADYQAIEDKLRREVREHLSRCRRRLWAESRPYGQPVAVGDRDGKIQSWRCDDERSRIYEGGES